MTMPERPAMKQIALDIGLVSSPSFANFFCSANEAVFKHLVLWAGNALRSPVPTYLWGEAASGKTHLLQAVREVLREQGAASGWMDASMMEPPDFDERWAVLLLDDCHLYTAVQQQAAFSWFVNALNAPDGRPRWVLAAGNVPPADLRLRDDLRSRLGWGHVFALQALTELERRAVLRKEAESRGVVLSDEAMDFILSRFSRDLGSLMQLLDQLDAYALQTQRTITIPLIKSMLDDQ